MEEARQKGLDVQIKILDAQMEGPTECLHTARGFRNGMSDEAILDCVQQFKPDVTGITMNYTFGVRDVLEVAAIVKAACPSTLLVIGGAHATLDHRRVTEHQHIDVVVRGEGEVTFSEMCLRLASGRGWQDVAGLTYRDKGTVRQNPDRAPIVDLDTLPIPDRSLIPYADYLSKQQYFHTMQSPVATMFTSRGCPFHCIFCSTQKTWGNHWRGRSAAAILMEVEYLRDRYGVKEIAFDDDQFLGDRKRIIEFCRLAVQKKLGMTFIVPSGNSPAFLNEELLDWMARSGFYRICFSVDVGTDSAVRYVRKPVRLDNIRHIVKEANRRGLWTYGTFVIGFPFEGREDILATMRFAYHLKLDFLRFYIAQPYFGSELYERYEREGRLAGHQIDEQHSAYDALFGTDHLSAQELIALRNEAEGNYMKNHFRDFLNPAYLATEFLPKIMSVRRMRYFIGLALRFTEVTANFKKKPTQSGASP